MNMVEVSYYLLFWSNPTQGYRLHFKVNSYHLSFCYNLLNFLAHIRKLKSCVVYSGQKYLVEIENEKQKQGHSPGFALNSTMVFSKSEG